ncbi:MAG: sulfatase-like hydrolase/transferase [Actinomycetota bacterium]
MTSRTNLPNVIVVVLDTARADAFEPYGAPAGASPTLTQLASEGAAHPTAIAPSNWTMPSHASMFSGLLPRAAGLSLLPNGKPTNCRIVIESLRDRWLPEVLRRSGYATAAATTNTWVSEQIGFATGFDDFQNLVGKRVRRMHDAGVRGFLRWYAQAFLARVDDGLKTTEDQVRRWIDQADRPFFWFINLIECHSPYLPPQPYNDLGPLNRLAAARDARRYQTLTGVWRACATGVTPPQRSLRRMRHMYDRSIRMMDDWLERVCDALDRRGLLDETLLVVTSDHGENFGEGNLFGHAVSLDDRLIKVPLVFRGPGAPAPNGVTSLAALPRLLADAIDLQSHPWSPGDLPAGPAVAQYDVTKDPDEPGLQVIRDWGATEEGVRRFALPCTAATDGRYKLVRLGTVERLYDLERDPLELEPIREEPPDVVAELRRSLHASDASEWTPDLEALRAAGAQDPKLGDAELKELEDRMRLLGYL